MDGVSTSIMEMGLDLNHDPMNTPSNSSSDYVVRVNHHHSPNDLQWENNIPVEQRIRCIQHLSAHMSSCPRGDHGGPSGSAGTKGENISTNYNSNSSDLVAKALEKEMLDLKKEVKKKAGSYYDCNVCFELAKDPVITCCGHLFCWNCFYNIPYFDSCTKECPVCDGEVSDSTVIPIYGNGGGKNVSNEEHTSNVPPRPKSRRVESVRPLIPVYLSHVPVVDALRRIRISFGNGPNPSYQRTSQSGVLTAEPFRSMNVRTGRRMRPRPLTRVSSASYANLLASLGIPDGTHVANALSLDVFESNSVVRDSTPGVGVVALPVSTSSLQPSDVSVAVPSYPYNLRSRSRSANETSTSGVGNRDSNASRRRRLN